MATAPAMSSKLKIDYLNDDVLLEIINYLDIFGKIAMRQVCQRLETLVDDHLSRKIKSFYIDEKLDKESNDIIKHFGQHLDVLHLSSVNKTMQSDKLNKQILAINDHCTKLNVLKIETRKRYRTMTLSTVVMSQLCFENLKYLELHNIKMEKDLELAPAFENVEVLKLDSISNFSGHALIHLRKLTSLQLTSCGQLKSNYLYDFFKTVATLKEIVIHMCREIDEIIINEIILYLPQIEVVSVWFSFVASIDPSRLDCLTQLKSLSLQNFRTYNVNRFIQRLSAIDCLERWEINGEDIKLFRLDNTTVDRLERCSRLNELSFVKCNFLTDELLLRLAKNLRLSKFHVRDCWGFTTNGLMKFVQLSKELSLLEIKNCTILRTATIEMANLVLEEVGRPSIKIDYDIDCGFRSYEDEYWSDSDENENYYDNTNGYCDSNSSDGE